MRRSILVQGKALQESKIAPSTGIIAKLAIYMTFIVTLAACGAGGIDPFIQGTSIDVIQEYAESAGTTDEPSLSDYSIIGVENITDESLDAVNTAIADSGNVDSVAEIQAVVDTVVGDTTVIVEPVDPDPIEVQIASLELGEQVYAEKCAVCHMPLETTTKPDRDFLGLSAALRVIPVMQNLALSDVEIESVILALSGTEVANCEVETLAPRLSRLTADQYDNTVNTFIPDVVSAPSDGFDIVHGNRFSTIATGNMSTPHVTNLIAVSSDLADLLVARPETLAACQSDDIVYGDSIASGEGTEGLTTIDFAPVTARYIRIAQTGVADTRNWWSFGDLNVLNNNQALDRADWVLEGSSRINELALAIDNSATTRWSSGSVQSGNEWITIDLGSTQTISQITLINEPESPLDYPREYEVRVAGDFSDELTGFSSAIDMGQGTEGTTTINLESQTSRYLRISNTGTASNGWGIGEINVLSGGSVLDRSDWILSSNINTESLGLSLDGDLDTRWVTTSAQVGNEWIVIDFGSEQTFDQVVMEQRPQNQSAFIREYEVRIGDGSAGVAVLSCDDQFLSELLERAFRRPVEDEDLSIYRGFYESAVVDLGERLARKTLIQRVLLSPEFLFRTELGSDGILSNYELASAVSYLISDSPPDDELYAAAVDGSLSNEDVLLEHAERLLSQRSTSAGIENFFRENLQYDDVQGANKDDLLFPDYSEEITSTAMVNETKEFIANVMWEDDATISTLLGARYTMLNQDLQGIYGVSGLGENFERVDLGQERGGILTQPSSLAFYATNEESDIVHRGLYVAEKVLCRVVPAPPEEVADAVVNIDGSTPITQRVTIEQHSSEALCASCHVLFDDFGTVLEHFDAVGGYRDEIAAFSFDTGSDYTNLFPVDASVDILNMGSVSSPGEMIDLIATSDEATSCFAERLSQYTLGNNGSVAGCEADVLTENLRASGGDMRAAILSLISSAKFQQRIAGDQ